AGTYDHRLQDCRWNDGFRLSRCALGRNDGPILPRMTSVPTEAWPWLALAGLGFFHGINPAMGWLFAVALGLHRKSGAVVLLSLLPIALGHAVAIAVVVFAVLVLGLVLDHGMLGRIAGTILIGCCRAARMLRRATARTLPCSVGAAEPRRTDPVIFSEGSSPGRCRLARKTQPPAAAADAGYACCSARRLQKYFLIEIEDRMAR